MMMFAQMGVSADADRLEPAFAAQRHAFNADMNPTATRRLDQLARVLEMTEVFETEITRTIGEDFGGRAVQETALSDIFMVRASVAQARSNLRRWMKPRRVKTALQFLPGRNELLRQPIGVVGVVSPWNYPYQLAICPAVAALAAGNRVMIKPSELTPAFSALLYRMVARYFREDELTVITGDTSLSKRFVSMPFDHLFFTGSTPVGRNVAQAAARNLTPVTLELGGKSPVLFDSSADLEEAAPRVAYGKLLNAGQTCVAPDYLLVPRDRVDECASAVLAAARKMYPTLHGNPDFTSIISERHLVRLRELLEDASRRGARLLPLHDHETPTIGSRQLMPTLVLDVTPDMAMMHEEIFGPILPVIGYDSIDQAISMINEGARPLALYWFGEDKAALHRVLRETLSGGVTVNDCVWHLGQENQPFGGVGASGYGAYHGEWGFRTFSKEKPVFHQSRFVGIRYFYPPYGASFRKMMGLLHHLT